MPVQGWLFMQRQTILWPPPIHFVCSAGPVLLTPPSFCDNASIVAEIKRLSVFSCLLAIIPNVAAQIISVQSNSFFFMVICEWFIFISKLRYIYRSCNFLVKKVIVVILHKVYCITLNKFWAKDICHTYWAWQKIVDNSLLSVISDFRGRRKWFVKPHLMADFGKVFSLCGQQGLPKPIF